MENTYKRIVVLDKNNNVKYTNLKKFPDSLTDKDVKYLIGENEQGKTVKRTSFVTDKNKKYNMIIYGHVASFSKVKRLVKHMGEGLSLILLFYGIILTTFVFWIKRRINRPVSIVNHALQKMGSGKNLEKLQYEGILEFENICKSFNHMTEELERTKREKNNMISDISFLFLGDPPGPDLPPNVRFVGRQWDMNPFYSLCDVLICRAGGSTLAEVLQWGIPAVVVPWEGAAEGHQERKC